MADTPATLSNTQQPPSGHDVRKEVFGNRRYFVFFVIYVAAIGAFGSFVNDMYLPSLPSMTHFFHCAVPVVQLGLTTGMIGLGLGQILLGPISDKYGRKPVLIGATTLFCIAAVVSIFSPNIQFFVACRFVQGLGASGGYFLARAIPADVLSGRPLAKIMAIIGAINGIAPASAPVIGGFVADMSGWQGVFVVLTLYGVMLLAASPFFKETLSVSMRSHKDFFRTFDTYALLAHNRKFMVHTVLKGATLGLLFAYTSSAPFIYQTHFHWTQTQFGLWMGLNALAVAVGSMLALKYRYIKKAAVVGSLLLIPVIAAQAVFLFHDGAFWMFEVLNFAMLFGMGQIFSASNTLAMNEGRDHAGEASALLGIFGYVFGAVVSPLVGIGNIMHSTAVAYIVVTVIVVIFAFGTRRIAPDLIPDPQN